MKLAHDTVNFLTSFLLILFLLKLRTNIKINARQFFKHRYIHALVKLATAERIELFNHLSLSYLLQNLAP